MRGNAMSTKRNTAKGKTNMKKMKNQAVTIIALTIVLSALALVSADATQWNATVGAQSNDKGDQALAFLPNEIWIHAGDRIRWTFDADEIHTVTFLRADQPRPFFADGCPGFSMDPATYDGSTCVTTPPMVKGQTLTVIFPVAGNFKLVCLVHENMTVSGSCFRSWRNTSTRSGFL